MKRTPQLMAYLDGRVGTEREQRVIRDRVMNVVRTAKTLELATLWHMGRPELEDVAEEAAQEELAFDRECRALVGLKRALDALYERPRRQYPSPYSLDEFLDR